jgi:hypothetical protein
MGTEMTTADKTPDGERTAKWRRPGKSAPRVRKAKPVEPVEEIETAPKSELHQLAEQAGFANPTRKKSGINQAALARHLGVNVMSVNRWLTDREDGKPPPRAVILFLRAFVRLKPKDRAEVLAD